ncbi:MAG: toll/interleukin-1 receptor domain-containing protein, partial [Myxococcales bacterium]|nr:toll/interleukin-1 receptor domain-containing protein [Myxococcales bacterium]
MPPRFFLSYARGDNDGLDGRRPISQFYEDLKKELAQDLGLGQNRDDVGFIDVEIPTAEPWRSHLRESLGQADVLLCLISPNFLASQECGREWTLFELRMHKAGGRNRILPVIWRSPRNRELPRFVRDIQYTLVSRSGGYGQQAIDRYNRSDLRTLARESGRTDYSIVVEGIAQQIVDMSKDPLAPLGDEDFPPFETIVPKFPETTRTAPETPTPPVVSRRSASRRVQPAKPATLLPKELGELRVAAMRKDPALLAAVAQTVQRSMRWVERAIADVDGRARIDTTFAQVWPETAEDQPAERSLEDIAELTAATARTDPQLINTLAAIVHLTPRWVRRHLNMANGRTLIKNVFVDRWPDSSEPELPPEDLGVRRAAWVRDAPDAIASIAELTGWSERTIRSRLEAADGRSFVRNVFEERWPAIASAHDEHGDVEELGARTVASCRDEPSVVAAIAKIIGASHHSVRNTLSEWDGRYRIRTVFAESWPNGPKDDKGEPEPSAWDPAELGEQTAAAARDDDGMIEAIARHTEISRRWVRRKLNAAHGRSRVCNVFDQYWGSDS